MNGWLTPMGELIERPKHKCGRCANPFLGGRDDCPNNKPLLDDEQIALMLETWTAELDAYDDGLGL